MKIAFRADASIEIGTGHVMRCLTLAEALQQQGHECLFICREHNGHLGKLIAIKGFALHLLPVADEKEHVATKLNWNNHASWLGLTWQQDAEQTCAILSRQPIDWLVVDHYALDARWEMQTAQHADSIIVIDDLADREHRCNLLLDQTFGRSAADYRPLVPEYCELLCGSQYALLRPEFAELRPYSLQRREQPALRQLLITMGGVDKDNVTGQVLDALRDCELSADCNIVVVMGATAPWLEVVKQQADSLPWHTEVKVGVSNMAQLMADSDLAIGAAGATSWERCCLGVPTIMVVLADNQRYAAHLLTKAGAVRELLLGDGLSHDLGIFIKEFSGVEKSLKSTVEHASNITDGKGCERVVSKISIQQEREEYVS
ncbi:UDP-2,4-diacetamido-2,4,6-trideoxy-beta-L-altropyranose hydrolase [Oceanimonas baumannii]|uniref:UDP-2,4-diacetamido-2,4, 6-trideoxy-beta-L-altropyranose hydrolase n=1 Tax=Oceanimonas baumannii TaxID=129578 RepID=UPI001D17FA94|nr:UDP-2,4-diacetamido-2,4,6-trideoxy-beta-L-altropyranose hydrolase [Oceanimonas baumannii]MCC4264617.1 UDP-2,4-diacetamido-2,4,6-trideoxy-beta-L-altropyranose hydrolase [Oceanimonas baumannii]